MLLHRILIGLSWAVRVIHAVPAWSQCLSVLLGLSRVMFRDPRLGGDYAHVGLCKGCPWRPTPSYLPDILAFRERFAFVKCVSCHSPIRLCHSKHFAMYLSLEEISTWPTPNYINPVIRGPGLIIMHLVLYPIIPGLVGLRTYTRLRISRSFGLDDVFILLAMACSRFHYNEHFE